jgi:hypothetical protein
MLFYRGRGREMQRRILDIHDGQLIYGPWGWNGWQVVGKASSLHTACPFCHARKPDARAYPLRHGLGKDGALGQGMAMLCWK